MAQEETTTEETPEVEIEDVETTTTDHLELPDDHPLVKTLAKQKAELKELRKNSSQAQRELDEMRKQNLTDQERAIEEAKDSERKAVRMEFAEKLVDAELKSQLKDRALAGDAVFGFDKAQFLTEDGDVDSEAIVAWVEAHSSATGTAKPDLAQGARGQKGSLAQIRSRDELKNMTPDEILQARKDGRLDSLMGQ